ncbi:MAG: 16S rRNA (guanine(527)-N(7))-methyltransferase RsmG [Alphaproteobacteria bacterium]|nr:16S rRNA (guanine(527)-N(7))-methyltransferase RsmG [Alphaproteobacteria bacterium]NCQ88471.1 16S rRNA (guanine(527)-N(7))-methyltransferase RsmG [Alphaproteobacteria bacterium]NCT06014.1 16S rRNA (guanine(527)-N(7))-methyltransferase RsmG [Alphaproteobacteria bacterium]
MPVKYHGIIIPDEADHKLKAYLSLLQKWQSKINLISPQTLPNAWERHFIDSMQVSELLTIDDKVIFDFGSGAGFPGLVLAMLNPDKKFTMVESDQKKCSFMRTVSRETELANVNIVCERIEDVSRETKPDVIMARALASLDKLFFYSQDWIKSNPTPRFIFPKGEQYDQEVSEAQRNWLFHVEQKPSKTDALATILLISDVVPK